MDELIRRILSEGSLIFESQGWELGVKPRMFSQMRSYDLVEVCVTTPKGVYIVDWVVVDYSDEVLKRMLNHLFVDVEKRQ